MTLRPGLIVGYDRVPGGCPCRFELLEAEVLQAVWVTKCVATCYMCDFSVGHRYRLHAIAIVFDPLAAALRERFGSC